ncbi:MAG: nitroreductase [Bacteroidetes bacterium]|nr:nitroreductase [Bacteroidota bacterium]
MMNMVRFLLMIGEIFMLFSCKTGIEARSPLSGDADDMHKIIYYATLAGSSHNTQPWKVEVRGDREIRLFADTARVLNVVDPTKRELYISLGAFIENLDLAAGSLGYKTDIELTPTAESTNCVAVVTLKRAHSSGFDLRLISARRTLRLPFHTADIRAEEVKKIVTDDSQTGFYATSTPQGRFIAEQTLSAYRQQAQNRAAQAEFARWVRFSDRDIRLRQDGITTAGMEINGIKGFVVRNFFKPADAEKSKFVQAGIQTTEKQVRNCGGWLVLTGVDNSMQSWLDAGRRYQRMNIACTALRIGFHPMNQLVEEENYKQVMHEKLRLKNEILFVARIGYMIEMPAPVSPRRSVDSVAVFYR